MDERYRAIIIENNNILLMKRTFNGNVFYVFPGGGKEGDETPKECCERELLEEFGIEISAQNMIYQIIQGKSRQGYFVAKWKSGQIHKTNAEEYTENNRYGTYEPTMINLQQIDSLAIMPPEVKQQLQNDLKEFGETLNRPLIEIHCADFKR